jgi:hypothetical protein
MSPRDTGCSDPVHHLRCEHPGWREAAASDSSAVLATQRAATFAEQDLKLESISVRWFEPGPRFVTPASEPSTDNRLLIELHSGWFSPNMMGKACSHDAAGLRTVWIRAGLSPALTAAVVLHEARHLWQWVTDFDGADDEQDAERYMWLGLRRIGFTRREITMAKRSVGERHTVM